MNTSASIRTRLSNIARRENIAFNVIIVRYLHERMLYRISCSRYADRLLLKGGNFMYAIQGLTTRPTRDMREANSRRLKQRIGEVQIPVQQMQTGFQPWRN